MAPKRRPLDQRILESVVVDPNGCWLWQKYVKPNGYGVLGVPGRSMQHAHRIAYEVWRGPIPDGLQIDHLCRVRHCCNPDHLEAVTPRTNNLRGRGPSAKNARAQSCPKGHPYDASNTYHRPDGTGRDCRTCRAAARTDRAWRNRRIFGVVPAADRKPAAIRTPKSHCRSGHPLSGDNLYVDPRGERCCRTCRRESLLRSRARRMPATSDRPVRGLR